MKETTRQKGLDLIDAWAKDYPGLKEALDAKVEIEKQLATLWKGLFNYLKNISDDPTVKTYFSKIDALDEEKDRLKEKIDAFIDASQPKVKDLARKLTGLIIDDDKEVEP